MTTYTTPQFATAPSDRDVRLDRESINRAPSRTTPYGVAGERAALSEGPTPDWQPGAAKGVPKAAIGALGAALVGGAALAIVLMAPSNKVTKTVMPDPIAQAAAQNAAAAKSVDQTDAAVKQLEDQAPAAGSTAAAPVAASAAIDATKTSDDTTAAAPATPTATAPAVHPQRQVQVTPRRAAAQPVRPTTIDAPAPATTIDAPAPPTSGDAQTPAIQPTPAAPTVTPSVIVPAPAEQPAPAPATPDPAPAPAQQ